MAHGGTSFRRKTRLAALCTLLALLLAGTAHAQRQTLDDFSDLSAWTTATAPGVTAHLSEDDGALRLDFDFGDGGGYAIARRDLSLTIPDHYRFSYRVRARSRTNDLEFKLIDPSGENVWWHNRRQFRFPSDWKTLSTRPRHVSFAWGPALDRTLREVGSVEFVVAAVEGGKGTLWIDDFAFEKLPPPGPPVPPTVEVSAGTTGTVTPQGIDGWTAPAAPRQTLTLDFGTVRELGGIALAWDVEGAARPVVSFAHPEKNPERYVCLDVEGGNRPIGPNPYIVMTSEDGERFEAVAERGDEGLWHRAQPHRTFYLPEHEARYVRVVVRADEPVRLEKLELLPVALSDPNAFFARVAEQSPRGFYPHYFDSTQVYWTVTGEAGAMEELLVSETGAVELKKGAYRLDPFLYVDDSLRTWAGAAHAQSLEDGYLPIPTVTRAYDDGLEIDVTAWATGDGDDAVVRYVVRNEGTARRDVVLALALRPFQVNPPWQFLNGVGGVGRVTELRARGGGVVVDRSDVLRFMPTPGVAPVSATWAEGGMLPYVARGETPRCADVVRDADGWLETMWGYNLHLDAHGADTVYVSSSFVAGRVPSVTDEAEARVSHDEARADWRSRLERVRIRVPGSDLVETVRANLAYVLVNQDGPSIQPGSRSYDRSWIRDGTLTSAALLRLGLWDDVRTFLEWYAPYQYENGYVPCCVSRLGAGPTPEHDSHGQLVYGIAEYVRFTKDRAFAEAMWPHVEKALAFMDTLRATHRTAAYRSDTLRAYYDLLPASISHEGYSERPMHAFWDYAFAFKGYKDAAYLAHFLDKPDAANYDARADTFRATLKRSYELAMQKENIDYLPGSVELGDFDATSTTTLVSPAGAADLLPDALEATFDRYMAYFRQRRDGAIAWANYTPYEWRVAGTLVRMGRIDEANEVFDFFFGDRRPTGWRHWAEVVWRDASAPRFIGDMPHTWVGSDFMRSALDLFAFEDDERDALVVGAGLRAGWLEAPGGVAIEGLHTWFGPLTYTAARTGDALVFTFAPGLTTPPGGLVLRPVYGAARRVEADGQPAASAPDGSVRLSTVPTRITFYY